MGGFGRRTSFLFDLCCEGFDGALAGEDHAPIFLGWRVIGGLGCVVECAGFEERADVGEVLGVEAVLEDGYEGGVKAL